MLTVLIAEESQTIQKVIRIALDGYSIEFLYASNYAQVLQVVKTHPLDGVIADSKLPGLQIPAYLTETSISRRPPTVFLFADSKDRNQISSVRKGTAFLKKPFSAQDLIFVLTEELELKLKWHKNSEDLAALPNPKNTDSSDQMKTIIEDYCKKHFKEIAQEVLTKELKHLADLNAKRLEMHR